MKTIGQRCLVQQDKMLETLSRHRGGVSTAQLDSFKAKHIDLQKTYDQIQQADDIARSHEVAFECTNSLEFEDNDGEKKSKMAESKESKEIKFAIQKYYLEKFKSD